MCITVQGIYKFCRAHIARYAERMGKKFPTMTAGLFLISYY